MNFPYHSFIRSRSRAKYANPDTLVSNIHGMQNPLSTTAYSVFAVRNRVYRAKRNLQGPRRGAAQGESQTMLYRYWIVKELVRSFCQSGQRVRLIQTGQMGRAGTA